MVKSLSLDRTFSALADPTRRAILERLSRGPATVTEIAAPFEMSLPAVMKHLSVLENSGLMRCSKHGRVRTCEMDARAVDATLSWLGDRKQMWEKRLDALSHMVEEKGKANEPRH